jgi:acyl-CoA thioesterase FadM
VLVETQLLGHDVKRLLLFHRLLRARDEAELATAEQLMLHVDTDARRAAPAGPEVLARVAALAERHAALERPASAGRAIALERRGS